MHSAAATGKRTRPVLPGCSGPSSRGVGGKHAQQGYQPAGQRGDAAVGGRAEHEEGHAQRRRRHSPDGP